MSIHSMSSVTKKCSQKSADRFDRKILIVNTTGIFDTTQINTNIQQEIIKCIRFTLPGPHAFILVHNMSRFTTEEQSFVQQYVDYFGENIFQYLFVLFTFKDYLDEKGITIDDYIESVSPILKTFIEKCGKKVIAFDNRLNGEKADEQVRELLTMILKNVEQNNGKCYRNEMYKEAEQLIQAREDEKRKQAQTKRDKEHQAMKKLLAEEFSKETENN